jgi:hypothetical protein
MSEPDSKIKDGVVAFLREQGLAVTEIPRRGDKTPDLHVERGTPEATLIEIKEKTDDPVEMDNYFGQIEDGRIASRSRPTGKRNRIDGLVTAAVSQFQSEDPQRKTFRVIWFHCEGHDAHLNELQIPATLYGTQKLVSTERSNILTAYYFWNSAFFRHAAAVHGAVLSKGGQACLMLNDHSPRFEAFRMSKLVLAFQAAVFWPQKHEGGADVLICNHGERRDTEEISLNHLRNKYMLKHLQTMNMGMLEAATLVPEHKIDNG